MRIAIISDIHSNFEALVATLREIERLRIPKIYCLGDIVGYGPEPARCLDLVRRVCSGVVRGNHDEAVGTERGMPFLPKDGQKAAKHNRSKLSEEQLDYLAALPYVLVDDGMTFVHASPLEPQAWVHMSTAQEIQVQFDFFETDICFVGHTHLPAIMANKLGVFRVRRGCRYLINVGSVGQPRDMNPRASFAVFDTDEFTCDLHRVPYDIEATVMKIRAEKLPKSLGKRLTEGR